MPARRLPAAQSRLLLVRLLLGVLLILTCAAMPTRPPATARAQDISQAEPTFSLVASVKMSRGYLSQAAWLDDEHLLSLVVSPDSVEVWRTNIDTLERDRYISHSLITGHICPLSLADRLSWTVSPQRNYIFFKWFEDSGTRRWALLDISEAPKFRLKQFAAPAGMQISRVLFSEDDRYGVFIDDSFIEGSTVSVLAMDLQAGTETWRINTQALSFVVDEWWREDLAPRTLQIGASVYNGEFYPAAGLATASLSGQTLEYAPAGADLITGTGARWGWASCSRVEGGSDDAYFLEIQVNGVGPSRVDLDLRPIDLLALDSSGCVLLVNSADLVTNKLWLVCAGSIKVPEQVDGDCREAALSPKGKLLVLAGSTNEIRIYQR